MYGRGRGRLSFNPRSNISDPQVRSFLDNLHKVYSIWKKNETFYNMLYDSFKNSENPYQNALYITTMCADFTFPKQGLAFAVMDTFKTWLLDNTLALQCLNEDVKQEACKIVVTTCCTELTKLILTVCQLHNDRQRMLPVIQAELENKKYKEACILANLLNLHDCFTVEDFVIPLVLQDRLMVAEDFLAGSAKHQHELVQLLDNILGQYNVHSEMSTLAQKLNVDNVKFDKLQVKPLKKLVARLTKKFNLSNEACPNLRKKQQGGALQYLMYKRYVDQTIGAESWHELIIETVQNDTTLQVELVQSVAHYGSFEEAAYWAKKYNVSKDELLKDVITILESEKNNSLDKFPVQQTSTKFHFKDHAPKLYHKLSLPVSSIIMVDNVQSYLTFVHQALKGQKIAGFDAEWKPYFGNSSTELALLQIAVSNQIFLIDTITLKEQLTPNQWSELGNGFFFNDELLKLGFGIISDLKAIEKALPHIGGTVSSENGSYLDLYKVWQRLICNHNFSFPYSYEEGDQSSGEGLTNLVYLCFGSHLNKDDQFSNWERRPLRDSQKTYAALDAYCLLDIYEVLKNRCSEQDIDFHNACFTHKRSHHHHHKHAHSHAKFEDKPPETLMASALLPRPELKAKETKLVCDTMVQGLGKRLRQLGIDTYILNAGMDHTQCARIAHKEGRFIITRGFVYKQLQSEMPEGHVLKVNSDQLEDQINEVLTFFNISVANEDIFTRCQHCNCDSFMILTNNQIRQKDVLTRQDVPVQTYGIPPRVFYKFKKFYVCDACGRCYWDGSHLDRFLQGKIAKAATSSSSVTQS